MTFKIILPDKEHCTGCMACVNSCKQNSIEIKEDTEGFLYPSINQETCLGCGLCSNVCPILNYFFKTNIQEFYASWSTDKKVRRQSSSGGIFAELANRVLENKGIVFGASFDETLKLKHSYISSSFELHKLQGSKYLQSQIGNIYQKVKYFLEIENKQVLFSGTPCQIAGLKKFLGKEYELLITVDLVCHGVPSPLFFEKYINYLERTQKAQVKDICFRDKSYSWRFYNTKIIFNKSNRNRIYKILYGNDLFMKGVLKKYFFRPSCYSCKFSNMERVGDITLGDFWGYNFFSKVDKKFEREGVSLVIINSLKGKKLFQECTNIFYQPKLLKEALHLNLQLTRPVSCPVERELVWDDFRGLAFEKVAEKWLNHGPSFRKQLKSFLKYGKLSGLFNIFQRFVKICLRKK